MLQGSPITVPIPGYAGPLTPPGGGVNWGNVLVQTAQAVADRYAPRPSPMPAAPPPPAAPAPAPIVAQSAAQSIPPAILVIGALALILVLSRRKGGLL